MKKNITLAALVVLPVLLLAGCTGQVLSDAVDEVRASNTDNADPNEGWVHVRTEISRNGMRQELSVEYWMKCSDSTLVELNFVSQEGQGIFGENLVETSHSDKCTPSE